MGPDSRGIRQKTARTQARRSLAGFSFVREIPAIEKINCVKLIYMVRAGNGGYKNFRINDDQTLDVEHMRY
jgi:hypothetical protein